MAKVSRFSRSFGGNGCYTCRSCGKKTRETGEGESSCELCKLCFVASGYENSLSDHGYGDKCWGMFDGCKTVDEIETKYAAAWAELVAAGKVKG